MAILKASKQTYEFTLDEMKALIASDLGVPVNAVSVDYVQGDIGLGDPMDRYPAPRGVVGIKVTVDSQKINKPTITNSLASQIASVESRTSQWDGR